MQDNQEYQQYHRQKKEMSDGRKKYNKLVHDVFEDNPKGRQLIESWIKYYIFSQSIPPKNDPKPDWWIYIREGENKFIRRLLADIKLHKNEVGEYNE